MWLTCTIHSISDVSWFTGTIMTAAGISANSINATTSVVYCTVVGSCVSMVTIRKNVIVPKPSYKSKKNQQLAQRT